MPKSNKATIPVRGLKLTLPLQADMLPKDLVPADGPTPETFLELALENTPFKALARINAKNYKKMLKTIEDNGAERVVIVLQGTLRAPAAPGGPYVLEGAGFSVNVKTPKPAESTLSPEPEPGPGPTGEG
jgi:hypothetical protein